MVNPNTLCLECKWGTVTVYKGKEAIYCQQMNRIISGLTTIKRCKWFVPKHSRRKLAAEPVKRGQVTLEGWLTSNP